MLNFRYPGKILNVAATPTGGYTSGRLYLYGNFAGIAAKTTLVNEANQLHLEGVYELAKAASQAWAFGDPIFWDVANNRCTKDSSVAGRRIGVAAAAVANGSGDVLGEVRLDGAPLSGVQTIRRRFSVAEINAGETLLPAIVGGRYRMVDAKLIAVGGAAATATSVDIVATLSASTRKLVAAAVAGIAQSVVARAGASNIAVLADGASFTANDVNTAIAVGKTGSDLATATHIDVEFQYVLESAAA